MATQAAPSQPPVRQDLAALFTDLEQSFSTTNLGPDRWYLIVLAALVGGTEPELADQLYIHIINQPTHQSPQSRQALVRRLREALVKLVSIVGVCKPLEAILSISKVERPEDRDYTFTRKDWNADAANHERGANWLKKIYAGNTEDTLALFDAHKDFRWISEEITYGLYLSDRQVLDDWDTEVVVLSGIMIQNLKLETRWHIRGALRVGMSKGNVVAVMGCVRRVAEFTEVKLNRIPSVEEVEHEVFIKITEDYAFLQLHERLFPFPDGLLNRLEVIPSNTGGDFRLITKDMSGKNGINLKHFLTYSFP
ncbi:hypothetical protein SLS61_004512 [Didymella pomorum]